MDGDGGLRQDDEAARAVVERCAAIDPRLADARVVEPRVGPRPTRSEVRVETDSRGGATPVVRNYGHGGVGVTLSWGYAREAAGLVAGIVSGEV
ncbi:hypothetical protein [Streptomyces mirabilis]